MNKYYLILKENADRENHPGYNTEQPLKGMREEFYREMLEYIKMQMQAVD